MKRLRTVVFYLLVLVVILVAGAWALARSSSPAVPLDRDEANENEAALRELFRSVGDPRKLEDGQLVEVRLDQSQLDAVAAEASRRTDKASVRLTLREGGTDVLVAAASPRPWITPYVNLRATVRGNPRAPQVESVSIGNLPLPSSIGQRLFDTAYAEAQQREPLIGAFADAVEDIQYDAEVLTVRIRWSEEARHRIRTAGRAAINEELGGPSLGVYAAQLERGLAKVRPDREETNLVRVMTPIFQTAQQRVDEGLDARQELEAAIVVLTIYSLHHPLSDVVGPDAPKLRNIRLNLQGRSDLTKHFLVSAMTTLFAERTFADALGLAKELRDSEDEDGSGFSFRDLAADRAGTRLMQQATSSPARLRVLIDRLAHPLKDGDLVPVVDDLPEGMDAETFQAAYENVESETYRALIARIDARTDRCPVHIAVAAAK